ncbi:uncharacterized protein LOC115874374 [Sitophilus oryzae]|uniref:Uncharacterized protein LOC115874374 n=1 Tax=Sitophilus oryzae TaxID=7048 RepID=A0A6J2X319_SITOR|nr:uncharacterized protein LOC115874374 [Sitophilus oryzae]
MLQPRKCLGTLFALAVLLEFVQGFEYASTVPRRRREDNKDVTTVLLVDAHGKNSLGRFLSVRPDVGLITSTARTFIQDGVTTEYATQVLGTTLDNGRLYAHLLTKTSRVLYDNDLQTKGYEQQPLKNDWKLDQNANKNFVRNTDFISPDPAQAVYVFPTSLPFVHESSTKPQPKLFVDQEILKEAQSNNARVIYDQQKYVVRPENHIVKINAQNDFTKENIIHHKDNPIDLGIKATKVRAWDNLPTFTVRNEFSPSGLSFIDLPDFDSNTERSKLTSPADRKAKLLFKAGLLKPNTVQMETVTYTGFADFTTTVANTVIVFTPHTSDAAKNTALVTKIAVEPTIRPTAVHRFPFPTRRATIKTPKEKSGGEPESTEPTVPTTSQQNPTFITTESKPTTTQKNMVKLEELFTPSGLNKLTINKEDRNGKINSPDEPLDLAAKMSVLANEQKQEGITPPADTTIYSENILQPSETQPVMLSTPSAEDIAKILASLQAQAKMATEPLNSKSETLLLEKNKSEVVPKISTGATTIFFEDDFSFEPTTTQSTTTTPSETVEKKETTTTEQPLIQTTSEKGTTTTEKYDEITTTEREPTTTPEITENEIDTNKAHLDCHDNSKIVPTTVYKTLTYLTTFYIPLEDSTSTSIKSNVVVSSDISLQTVSCHENSIQANDVVETTTDAAAEVTEPIELTTEDKLTTTTQDEEESDTTTSIGTTTPQEITTETRHVTESEPETTEATTDEGDEVELIFKTLYTTYTYLTTYFQDSTSSVASRIVVTTNVITSTLDPGNDATDPAMDALLENSDTSAYKSKTVTFDDLADIQPSAVGVISSTQQPINTDYLDTVNDHDESKIATPILDDKHLQTANGIKTLYTTYTYFTTIFVDGETEISSRTEVYTNYVTPSAVGDNPLDILATKLPNLEEDSVSDTTTDNSIESQLLLQNRLKSLKFTGANNYSSINRQKSANSNEYSIDVDQNDVNPSKTQNKDEYITLNRDKELENKKENENDILDLSEYETISTMVTDVRSSTSKGDQRIIENLEKRNVLVDDQVFSESNNDSEIIPSPTLLLQTSYTTFTYFTTMYHGTTSSDIASRLETVTNVVTTTLTPTQVLQTEDASLPVTYYTTFTYWTTFYKEGQTKVTSREETISNIVTPDFKSTEAPEAIIPLTTSTIEQTISPTATLDQTTSQTETAKSIIPSSVGEDELTTFFTTYTYYTTSYIGDETILNSRLETVTNVLNNTEDTHENQIGSDKGADKNSEVKSTGLLSTIVNTIENNGTTTVMSTDVFGTFIDGVYAKVLESTSSILLKNITPSATVDVNIKPTGIVSINQGKIVDADGVSTLFYTTQAVGKYIDDLYAQVIESTSSLTVNEERKAALPTDLPTAHRTGLVRRIEGSIIQNQTTTLYESKVLGTIIDGRYAQVIESTSSFILPTASASINEIVPTPTKILGNDATAIAIAPTPVVLEGSLSDSVSKTDENSTEETGEDEEDDDKGKSKGRLGFQPKKNTFTPAIRPFAPRQRPPFAPRRNKSGTTTAATITRSDFTPTVTAVPASKTNRFGGRRSSSGANQAIQPTASGGRRFSRPKTTTTNTGGRRNSASQIKPTATGFRRTGNSRTSSVSSNRSSSLFGGNSRFRIRPTAAGGLSRSPSSKIVTETPPDGIENDLTTAVTDNPTDSSGEASDTTLPLQSTTEQSRRGNNPLLRFKRPPIARANPVSRTTTSKSTTKSGFKANKGSTTTAKPKTTFARPNSALNRPRAGGLFPRRNLFTTTTTPAPEDEAEEEGDEDLEEEGEDGDEEEDTDYESSLLNTQTETAPTTPTSKGGRAYNGVQIRPFRKRAKRQAIYSRFRRPTGRTTAAPSSEVQPLEEPTSSKPSLFRNRYQANKYKAGTTSAPPSTTNAPPQRQRISPTKPSSGRTQFTLREKDTSLNRKTNFKARNSISRRTTTSAPRSNSRLRSGFLTESSVNRKTTASSRKGSRTRGSTRRPNNRRGYQNDQQIDDNFVIPKFDGTVTVTYQIPIETTISLINGKVTEYQNIVSAKQSTQVLNPKQYSTSVNPFGKEIKVLLSENTAVGNNGATLVTQFVLNETPTTSVTFTPTTIGGRKTSFSHVVPSTVYQVEEVVNTIQPALAAQAPLANILLSQLLLGGALPQNPLLGLPNNPGVPAVSATPTTEYKTRTSTRVTTVTSTIETILPLTFRGKEILTTIFDSTSQVITAIDYFTDTVVVTPTLPVFGQAPQLNTLILPLLQQQLQQQQQANQLLQNQALLSQTPAGVFNLNEAQQVLIEDANQDLDLPVEEEEPLQNEAVEVTSRAPKRSKKNKNKSSPSRVKPPKETSVITLYVSGRTPGDFTTVLSTVTVGEENRRKRETSYIPVRPSKSFDDKLISTVEPFDQFVQPATKEVNIEESDATTKETESLESIIGDVPKHFRTKTPSHLLHKASKATKKYTLKYVKASDNKDFKKVKSDGDFLA